jgi:hypothetical protein
MGATGASMDEVDDPKYQSYQVSSLHESLHLDIERNS